MDYPLEPSTPSSLSNFKANKKCNLDLIQLSLLLPGTSTGNYVYLSTLCTPVPPAVHRKPPEGQPVLPGLPGTGGVVIYAADGEMGVGLFILFNYD